MIIEDEAIEYVKREGDKRVVLLLCTEKDYYNCHRHLEIARRLFSKYNVKVRHIAGKDGESYVPTQADFLADNQQSLYSTSIEVMKKARREKCQQKTVV